MRGLVEVPRKITDASSDKGKDFFTVKSLLLRFNGYSQTRWIIKEATMGSDTASYLSFHYFLMRMGPGKRDGKDSGPFSFPVQT